ncbi:MAG: 4-hydroxy-3-methylbut-2-enyl diphosphate reductase [Bacteroidaceae bacterium]|nr:4-hydroxy-3-methylbut-2-enyl diphosphate reductase [Bacteroidaceae bacterium]
MNKDIIIEIDNDSGFCFGVTTAIKKAEEQLAKETTLYCLGDIVHNGIECNRLAKMGLTSIDHDSFSKLSNTKVLLRAHGEPPTTYSTARLNNIELIDATCPVVLKLQQKILNQYKQLNHDTQQIVIYGQKGHAEVLGLEGQTKGTAIVIEGPEDLNKIDFNKSIFLYSQTTKSVDDYNEIIRLIEQQKNPDVEFKYYNTICGQVSHRKENLRAFSIKHDLILFVCGSKSSNGKVLFNECLQANRNSHLVEGPEDINPEWLNNINSIGICGATSTPKWLMEKCKERINLILKIE